MSHPVCFCMCGKVPSGILVGIWEVCRGKLHRKGWGCVPTT